MAQKMMDALYFGRAQGWYLLLAFIVMPDHLHLLLVPRTRTISQSMQGLKGYTSRMLNAASGPLWQAGYYDYVVDTPAKAVTKRRYIEWNPVRAGLVKTPEAYKFSSAYPGNVNDWDEYFAGTPFGRG